MKGRGWGPSSLVELKSCDYLGINLPVDNDGWFVQLNAMFAGAAYYQRVGRRIEMKRVRINMHLDLRRKTTDTDYGRFILFYDRQPNGAVLTGAQTSDLLQNTDKWGSHSTSAQSYPNTANKERFLILKDFRLNLPQIMEVSAGVLQPNNMWNEHNFTTNWEWDVDLSGLTTIFTDGGEGEMSSISTGALYVFCMGEKLFADHGYWMRFSSRLEFYDI